MAVGTLGAPLAFQASAALPGAATRAEGSQGAKSTKAVKQPGTPFACNGQILESVSQGGKTQLHLGTAGAGTITFAPVGVPQPEYNAIAVNQADRLIYGMDSADDSLVTVDATGALTDLGAVTGLPASTTGFYQVGGSGPDGDLYVMAGGTDQNTLYRIDLGTRSATALPLSAPSDASDLTLSGGYFWGAGLSGTQGRIVRIDPQTGTVAYFPFPSPGFDGSGAAFTYGNGDLGFIENSTGTLYRVAVTNPGSADPTLKVVSTQTSPTSGRIDATSCFLTPADLAITKSSSPASYVPGQQITYTLRVTNNGPNASSGYTVTDEFPAGLTNVATSTPGCTVTGRNLSCTAGALPVGQSRDITATATVGPDATGTISNAATVRGNDPDPDTSNNTDRSSLAPSCGCSHNDCGCGHNDCGCEHKDCGCGHKDTTCEDKDHGDVNVGLIL
ncbi:DUF6923 family protein [Streptomyces sp. 142MFCol3.1]|uniref:DUF6923 family protein n=1 Tax=Streptomyces sp. 142MFCol3.1 TaxID=1172179 RepID=UPI0018F8800D|nr:DUF11 domain-containing protein [Streptomyces sp. 142MFCol3.1]